MFENKKLMFCVMLCLMCGAGKDRVVVPTLLRFRGSGARLGAVLPNNYCKSKYFFLIAKLF